MQSFDVAVIGGGPVGCVTALAHAKRGARVALLEASPERKNRFAGELLHPVAVDILAQCGVNLAAAGSHGPNRGFAVFTPEHSGPFLLRYPKGKGATFEFNAYVDELRAATMQTEGITWFPGARVSMLEGQSVHWGAGTGLRAGRIIGADGRFSFARKALGLPDDRHVLSHMAGLTLHGVELPFEGSGHVVLSRVGPALVYRIGPDAVRVCLDVPTPWKKASNRNELLINAYRPVLPEQLRAPIEQALRQDAILWAVNEFRPRTSYGRPGMMLVGDAVGHVHPMTAAGMTLGFSDAWTLAQSDDFESWAAQRRRDSEVPALLATALYEIFALQSEATYATRKAIYDLWAYPKMQRRTMNFLSGAETSLPRLLAVGGNLVTRASVHVASDARHPRRWRPAMAAVRSIAGLIHWLVNESVPEPMRMPFIQKAATPFEMLRQQQIAALTPPELRVADLAAEPA